MVGIKGNNQGLVWAPYIIQTAPPAIVESSFAPRMALKSRYSVAQVSSNFYMDIWMKNWKRKSKIENIYEIEKPAD